MPSSGARRRPTCRIPMGIGTEESADRTRAKIRSVRQRGSLTVKSALWCMQIGLFSAKVDFNASNTGKLKNAKATGISALRLHTRDALWPMLFEFIIREMRVADYVCVADQEIIAGPGFKNLLLRREPGGFVKPDVNFLASSDLGVSSSFTTCRLSISSSPSIVTK